MSETTRENHTTTISDKIPFVSAELAYIAKKSEKVSSAVHVITDIMNHAEAVRGTLRHVAVEIISVTYAAASAKKHERLEILSDLVIKLEYLLSLIHTAHTGSVITPMNAEIILGEVKALGEYVAKYIQKSTLFADDSVSQQLREEFTLTQDFFDVSQAPAIKTKDPVHPALKGIKQHKEMVEFKQALAESQAPNKEADSSRKVSYEENKDLRISFNNSQSRSVQIVAQKERRERILDIIREKIEVSINDIITRITGCSEKTLQRDLAHLIKEGHIIKKGSKRWSTYVLAR